MLDAVAATLSRTRCWRSRKDIRDAVRAARGAQPKWAGSTAYLRGQVLYRVAEMMEGRAAQLVGRARSVLGADADADDTRGRGRDRPVGLVRGLGRQDRADRRAR